MIEINTAKLENAADNAGRAAEECRTYVSLLDSKVMREINSYSGERSGNISDAQNRINQKRQRLMEKSQSLRNYESKIRNFGANVINQEERLKNKIVDLYGEFKKEYGIDSDPSWIDQFLDAIGMGTIKDFFYHARNAVQSIGEHIKNWYKYQGGKEFLQAVAAIAVTVLAVVSAFAAIISGAGVIACLIAGLAALCTTLNSAVSAAYQLQAMAGAAAGNTIQASRSLYHGDSETFGSFLRRVGQYEWATAFDVTDTVSSVLQFLSGGKKLLNNLKDVGGLKDMLKGGVDSFKDNISAFKDGFQNGLKHITEKNPVDTIKALKDGMSVLKNLVAGDGGKAADTVANNFFKYFMSVPNSNSETTADGKSINKMFNGIGDTVKLIDSGIKTMDKVVSLFDSQDSFNFNYNANSGKAVSNWKIPILDMKVGDFSSFSKFAKGVTGSSLLDSVFPQPIVSTGSMAAA